MPALGQSGPRVGLLDWPRAKSAVGRTVAAVAMAMNRRRVNDEPHFMDEGPLSTTKKYTPVNRRVPSTGRRGYEWKLPIPNKFRTPDLHHLLWHRRWFSLTLFRQKGLLPAEKFLGS